MKKIIVYRHGEYNDRMELTPESAQEVFARTLLIKQEIGSAGIVFTSSVRRAEQTAQVIALAMDGAPVQVEPLLAEHLSVHGRAAKERLITLATRQNCDTIAVVSHHPNIRQMFNISLNPGMEVIFEAETWPQIFEKSCDNLLSRKKPVSQEFIKHYFSPVCREEDLQKLRSSIDFLAEHF